jgi:hypothetical protein
MLEAKILLRSTLAATSEGNVLLCSTLGAKGAGFAPFVQRRSGVQRKWQANTISNCYSDHCIVHRFDRRFEHQPFLFNW